MSSQHDDPALALERAARDERAAVLGVLAKDLNDLGLAEDALQEAFVDAAEQWPVEGIPERPGAWLTTVARRVALRLLRREAGRRMDPELLHRLADATQGDPASTPEIPDARLELLLACCHRSLGLEAQVALTLRSVGGLTTAQIAQAFLVDEVAMAQRLVRARNKIRDSRIPFVVPEPERLEESLQAALGVIYLIFNEGYATSSGELRVRADLCNEAVRLAEILAELCPEYAEVHGLAALTRAHHARRPARTDASGRSVPLDQQDRSLYDSRSIALAERHLRRATELDQPGRYQIEGAIACAHALAPRAEATDWLSIAQLYDALAQCSPSPFVELNRAVAVGMAAGPEAGLGQLAKLRTSYPALREHHLLHSATAELQRRAGRDQASREAYLRALELAPAGPTREDLQARLGSLGA